MRIKRLRGSPFLRTREAALGAALLLGMGATTGLAQPNWKQASPAFSPPPRSGVQGAYDTARGRLVLFGGRDSSGVLVHDTWEWNGEIWLLRTSTNTPPPREDYAMAYDSARHVIVMFGGQDALGFRSDTWEWDGNDWTDRMPLTGPSARFGHAMAYDSAHGRVLLFGGMDASGYLSDTWDWDGTTWVQRAPISSPSPRANHAMAYDPVRNRVVLFGGQAGCVIYSCFWFNDTWEWNGSSWSQTFPLMSPSARGGIGLVYDPARGRTVLFGGSFVLGGPVFRIFFYNDTWDWDGTSWSQQATVASPTSRERFAMGYDPTCAAMVAFGGDGPSGFVLGDTWVLGSNVPVSLSTTTGSESGNEPVTITGTGFTELSDTTVRFGGAAATLVSVTCTQIHLRTPAGTSGPADVIVANSFGTATLAGAFTYYPPEIAARFGNVNTGVGTRENVLQVNGNTGDLSRELTVPVHQRIDAYMQAPSSRTTAPFVLYAWLGSPGASTLTTLPRGLGTFVFPAPFTGGLPQPRAIFNNIGHAARLGAATISSSPAPSPLFVRAGGSSQPLAAAFQGIIEDDGSQIPEHYSVTNAVILHVVP